MEVKVELTKRLAELAGFRTTMIDLTHGNTLGDVIADLIHRFDSAGAVQLLENGELHPSILVVVDGAARPAEQNALALQGHESIDLLLPIAGG